MLATKNAFHDEEATWINFRNGMGDPTLIAKVETKDKRKTGLSSVHRARFLNSLGALIPRDMVRFGKRLASIEETKDAHVRLLFEDGSQAIAAAVVGCDGVRSCVRQYVLDLVHPLDGVTYTKKYVYRGLVPMETAIEKLGEELANNSQLYLGPGGHILSYPIDGGATMNVVAFRDDTEDGWKHPVWVLKQRGNEMRADFEGWGEPVKKIVQVSLSAELRVLSRSDLYRCSTSQINGLSSTMSRPKHTTKGRWYYSEMQLTQRLHIRARERAKLWKMPSPWQYFLKRRKQREQALLRLLKSTTR